MLRALPELIEPDTWILAFHRTSPHWWVRWLACGRYKHVSAFAWLAPLRQWIVYEIGVAGTRIVILPDSQAATDRLNLFTADADLVAMPKRPTRVSLMPFSCVSAVKHLIGLRCGALRVNALYRECLAHGGELIHGAAPTVAEPADLAGCAAGQG